MHAMKALTGDATLDCRADAHMLAGGQGELLDDHGNLAHLVSIGHPSGQLELCCVQQHLEHCQVADQRVCSNASHLASFVNHVLSKCMCTWEFTGQGLLHGPQYLKQCGMADQRVHSSTLQSALSAKLI